MYASISVVDNIVQTLQNILPHTQIVLSILLVGGVLLQHSDASLGGAFGGADNWSATFHTRRGFEKTLFYGTIVIAVLFTLASIVSIAI